MTPATVKAKVAAFLGRPEDELPDEARLADVVPESFLLVQLAIELQEDLDFRLTADDLREVVTVGDLVAACVEAQGAARNSR